MRGGPCVQATREVTTMTSKPGEPRLQVVDGACCTCEGSTLAVRTRPPTLRSLSGGDKGSTLPCERLGR